MNQEIEQQAVAWIDATGSTIRKYTPEQYEANRDMLEKHGWRPLVYGDELSGTPDAPNQVAGGDVAECSCVWQNHVWARLCDEAIASERNKVRRWALVCLKSKVVQDIKQRASESYIQVSRSFFIPERVREWVNCECAKIERAGDAFGVAEDMRDWLRSADLSLNAALPQDSAKDQE